MKPAEDPFAPRGKENIKQVREALLRFVPAGWRLPFDRVSESSEWDWSIVGPSCFLLGADFDGDLNSVFLAIAREFNCALDTWAKAPRPDQPKKKLEKVVEAVRAVEVALNELDDISARCS